MSDTKIDQKNIVSISAIKAMGLSEDKTEIHMHNEVKQVTVSYLRGRAAIIPDTLPMEDAALLAYVDRLPQPRWRNLLESIIPLAVAKFGQKKAAAKWLGINESTISRRAKVPGYYKGQKLIEMNDPLG